MTAPTWTTPAGFLFTATELVTTTTMVVATGTPTYTLISGGLPVGLSLSTTGTISGAPLGVLDVTRSEFVIRARNTSGIVDRTFSMDVTGPDSPTWLTAAGYLAVGISGESYALNKQWVDYQLSAVPTQAPTDSRLKYYIANGDGSMPPGLTLSQSGRITGYVTDRLSYESDISSLGGYDDDAYDKFPYDHGGSYQGTVTDGSMAGLPKIYQFRVTASDGVVQQTRLFSIVVTDTTILTYNLDTMPADLGLSSSTVYVSLPQWINSSTLETVRANNNVSIDISAYDPNVVTANQGTTIYTVESSTDPLQQIPEYLVLDPMQGVMHGTIPYQPAYTRNYQLTVSATKYITTAASTLSYIVTTTNVFSLAIKGEVESTIQWVTGSDLGSIETGIVSELMVSAQQLNSEFTIKYELTGGALPPGLVLERDGSLAGKVNYGSTGTYTFTVLASDVYQLSAIERTFTVVSVELDSKQYTEVYMRPFLRTEIRNTYREFIANEFTFPPNLMYRYFDTNFGVRSDLRINLEFGLEKINLRDYVPALRENFYRKRFYFGDVKTAVAKDVHGTVIYELVYVDVVDELVNNSGVSVSSVVKFSDSDIYYPSTVDNMRGRLQGLVLPDGSAIGVNYFNLPRFMRTAQAGNYRPVDFISVLPLCYALPGQGAKIISRIQLSNFDFKLINCEVDRLIVQNSADNSSAKYLIFGRDNLADPIVDDYIIYGSDNVGFSVDSDDTPLTRESL